MVTSKVVTGRILQFDQARGYGFVAADDGGEDVFLHASVFAGDLDELVPGTKMQFKVMAGDRGRKAFGAYLADDEPEDGPIPSPRPVASSQLVPGPRPGPAFPPPGPAPSPPPAQATSVPVAQAPDKDEAPGKDQASDDEQMCDVLSPTEFGQELTELLLSNVSSLTGRQLLDVRQSVLDAAKKHGWVDI